MTNELQQFNFEITSLSQAMEYAKLIADSDLAPKDYKGKPGNVLIAIQYGVEIGLKPMQAIQNIAIINGRPAIWGDAMIGLVQNHHLCEYIKEEIKSDVAYCTVKRVGDDPYTYKFSKEDAKKAGLLSKPGPWSQYPERMLQMRARGFALRDKFSDVLKGIAIREEVMDYKTEETKAGKEHNASLKISSLIEGKAEKFAALQDVLDILDDAQQLDDLIPAASLAKLLSPADQLTARRAYAKKQAELKEAVVVVETVDDEDIDDETGEITPLSEPEKLKNQLLKASCLDTLNIAADLISSMPDENQVELREIYLSRKDSF